MPFNRQNNKKMSQLKKIMNKIEQKKINQIKKKEKKDRRKTFFITEVYVLLIFFALSLIIVISYITFNHFTDL